jgi:hypothetical protein
MSERRPESAQSNPASADGDTVVSKDGKPNQRRAICLYTGHVLVGIGFIGIALPVLPTTIFWILAAMCYARSSPERYQRLINHRHAGKDIKNFLDHGVISARGKRAALIGMAISAVLLILAPVNGLTLGAALGGLLIGAVYVISRPSEISAP